MNHITITHKELVGIGDRVKRGQKITSATAADGAYKLGMNANVFYLNYLGLTYEDGVVVAESFAKRMTHWTLHEIMVDIYVGDEVTQLANYGDRVSAGDILVESISNTRTVEGKANPGGSKEKNDKEGYMYLTNDYEVPNNIFGGIIVDASYEINPGRAKKKGEDVTNLGIISEFLEKIKNPSKENEDNINSVPKRYRNQKLGKTTKWSAQNKYGQSLKGRLRFKIAVERPLIIGDKLCNRYGSKGMVSCIIPDDCRPYYTDKNGVKHYADIVANPASIVGRMNVSQLHESLLSRCIDRFYEMAQDSRSEEDWESLLGLIHTYYGAQHKDLTVEGLKAMKDAGRTAFAMNVGTFVENSYDFVTGMAKDLGIKEDEEVYVPSVSIHERKDYDNITASGLEIRCLDDKDGNVDRSKEFKDGRTYILGWLDQPIVVGVNYYFKLYHSAVWSGSVTPSRKSRASKPILGEGKIRFSGQSMGEMEKWQLQATGASELYMDPVKSPTFESSQFELINTFLRGGFELS
jgi:DNA-directed RNA polymerase beta subunit